MLIFMQIIFYNFHQEVRRILKLEFVDSIYDKIDNSPVHRILRLQHGGSYLVRQREESSVLEVLYTGNTPTQISWPITKVINTAKYALAKGESNHVMLNKKVDRLIALPIARAQEREASKDILAATTARVVLDIVSQVMTCEDPPPESVDERELREYEEAKRARAIEILNAERGGVTELCFAPPLERSNARTHDKEVDVVSLHRLALESLHRMVAKRAGADEQEETDDVPLDEVLQFARETIRKYLHEVDVVVIGLNLVGALLPHLSRHKREVLNTILDCMQKYAPPAPPNRPRQPQRLKRSRAEQELAKAEEDALALAALMLKEEKEALRKQNESLQRNRIGIKQQFSREVDLASVSERRSSGLGRDGLARQQSGYRSFRERGGMSRASSTSKQSHDHSMSATADSRDVEDEIAEHQGPRISEHLLKSHRHEWRGGALALRSVAAQQFAVCHLFALVSVYLYRALFKHISIDNYYCLLGVCRKPQRPKRIEWRSSLLSQCRRLTQSSR